MGLDRAVEEVITGLYDCSSTRNNGNGGIYITIENPMSVQDKTICLWDIRIGCPSTACRQLLDYSTKNRQDVEFSTQMLNCYFLNC
jgi:hypothetical protein